MSETAALADVPVDAPERTSGSEPPALELRGIGKRYSLGRRPFERLRRRFRGRGDGSDPQTSSRDDEDVDDDDFDDDIDTEGEDEDDELHATRRDGAREIWALRDVSFDVPRGRSVAIIGGGGAGKTTLLKILSRVTPPTEGTVVARGQVAPLLGRIAPLMQGDFTGRQNVFLLSELYGVTRDAAAEHLDEILAFAGLTAFADTKLKKYSSGMQQQLGFSIVLNLEPDVMLADGAVTVGDPVFRARSLERLEERQRAGLALVIASNDTASLRRLCDEAIWLENGRIVAQGDVVELTQRYDEGLAGAKLARRRPATSNAEEGEPAVQPAPSSIWKTATVIDAGLFSMDGTPLPAVVDGQEALLEVTVVAPRPDVALACAITLVSGDQPVLRIVQTVPFTAEERGWYVVSGYFPAGALPAGATVGDTSAVILRPESAGDEPQFSDAVDMPRFEHVDWSWQRIRKRTSSHGNKEPDAG